MLILKINFYNLGYFQDIKLFINEEINEHKIKNIMDEATYIKERLEDQRSWYSKKAVFNKRWYYFTRVIIIIIAAIIPFIIGLNINGNSSKEMNYITGVLSLILAVLTGINTLYKFQENWINFRLTAETLKRERLLFETRKGPYKDTDSFDVLIERIENILSSENTTWNEYIISGAEKKQV